MSKKTSTLSSSAPPCAIAMTVAGHSTAKAAVKAGIDQFKIVKVAMNGPSVIEFSVSRGRLLRREGAGRQG